MKEFGSTKDGGKPVYHRAQGDGMKIVETDFSTIVVTDFPMESDKRTREGKARKQMEEAISYISSVFWGYGYEIKKMDIKKND